MTRNRSFQTLTAALPLLAFVLVTSAYAQAPSEARIQELIRLSAQAAAQTPGSAPAQAAAPTGPTLRLTMDDLVKLTLDHNLNIAVQRLNPQINDISLASLRTIYHPTIGSAINERGSTPPVTSVLNQGTNGAPTTDTFNYNGSFNENVQKGGGNFSASLNNYRQTSTSNNATIDPLYQSTWTFNYTQPLLKNFKIDSNREQIYIAKITRDMSDVTLRATITNTIANAQKAYWEYVYATEQVDVAQSSLDIANRLVTDNNTRVEVGTMAPLDVVVAQSQAAAARQSLVSAQATQRNDEIALKQFIVTGTSDPNWNSHIDAADHPDFVPMQVDVDAAIRRALSERTDLQTIKQTLEENAITYKYLNDQLRPQADLGVSYGTAGVGGTQLGRTSIGGVTSEPIPGGITDAFSSLFARTYPSWTVGLTLSYPLGQSAQEASVARAKVTMSQIDTQIKQAELQVATDVTNDATAIRNAIEAAQAAEVSVGLSQRQLDAEQSKMEVGMSTNYNVVLAQQALSTARQSQLRAIANYREALVEFERVQQTTLSGASITILH
jgi:outer membrane protein